MGLVTTKEFDALKSKVTILENKIIKTDASFYYLSVRVSKSDSSINDFQQVLGDIKKKHEFLPNGPSIKDADYTGEIISNELG